jgi:hypothetical protein
VDAFYTQINAQKGTVISAMPFYKSLHTYVGVLISLWLFLFAVQPKEFFLDGLKKLEIISEWSSGEYVE